MTIGANPIINTKIYYVEYIGSGILQYPKCHTKKFCALCAEHRSTMARMTGSCETRSASFTSSYPASRPSRPPIAPVKLARLLARSAAREAARAMVASRQRPTRSPIPSVPPSRCRRLPPTVAFKASASRLYRRAPPAPRNSAFKMPVPISGSLSPDMTLPTPAPIRHTLPDCPQLWAQLAKT